MIVNGRTLKIVSSDVGNRTVLMSVFDTKVIIISYQSKSVLITYKEPT